MHRGLAVMALFAGATTVVVALIWLNGRDESADDRPRDATVAMADAEVTDAEITGAEVTNSEATDSEVAPADADQSADPSTPTPSKVATDSEPNVVPQMPARDAGTVAPANRRRRKTDGPRTSPKPLGQNVLTNAAGRGSNRDGKPKLSFTENPVWATLDETRATFWWGEIPESIRATASGSEDDFSNIRRSDYVGADACKSCHPKKHETWSEHPHRWMNASANVESVVGDFSGDANALIRYRGGEATFYRDGQAYRMRLRRDNVERIYDINRTIGSRFQQYYVGMLVDGPEPENHPVRKIDHVLPFGYWIDQQEWVPVVHVDLELPDNQRHDPFQHPANRAYDRSCASCHTTQPAGDRMIRAVGRNRLAAHAPHEVHYDPLGFLQENHPQVVKWADYYGKNTQDKVRKALSVMDDLPAEMYAAALGITCEGCHNGARIHAENEQQLPRFFPAGKNVATLGTSTESVWGKNPQNANWTCAQCHTGGRSMFACGASTWNSTEYSDALRGACYDDSLDNTDANECLTCVHCHDPHVPTGKRWARTPAQDDASCLACHEQYLDAESRLSHTHHPAGSSGDRCMNCHMPRINEGMQDVVRTHLIFSPTDGAMLESNHPNACNLCHLQESIDWTIEKLTAWYGLTEQSEATAETDEWKIWSEEKLQQNYSDRRMPVALGWLASDNEATRLVSMEALAKSNARWAISQMIDMLDDPYLINRQFTQQRLEEMLEIDLRDFGYRHYQYAPERAAPIRKIQEVVGSQ